jgi:SAM-dependent methyltransferase
MEEKRPVTQPAEYLEELLGYLVCPVEGSPLTIHRDLNDQVVALRSRNGEYPVVENIPRLIPGLMEGTDRNLSLWRERQDQMWQDYQDGDEGVFSKEDEITGYIGEIIAQAGEGLCLDVGCGALPLPGYMVASSGQTRWIGIDPFLGDAARDFPFAQGLGEYLPFRADVFDGVLYASTIYHQMDPKQSLERTRRVIRPDGKLYIWYEPQQINGRYIVWKTRQALGWPCNYSRSFRWAFTRPSLRALLKRAGWEVDDEVLLCIRCPDYATCRDPAAYLVVARRA